VFSLEFGSYPQSNGSRPSRNHKGARATSACRLPAKVDPFVEDVFPEQLQIPFWPVQPGKQVDQRRRMQRALEDVGVLEIAAAGRDELLARRIGQNELDVIKVLQAIVDAQNEYASEDRNGDGVLSYAQKFASASGKHDGLYWPVNAGEPPSPLGALVARAAGQGYAKSEGPTPFHGYYYRMLKGQGKNAASGAFDYVVRGRAIGGFAVVAYPARYANSGIMTFIINQDGKVYEADLGRETQAKASAMQLFDPGKGWSEVKSP